MNLTSQQKKEVIQLLIQSTIDYLDLVIKALKSDNATKMSRDFELKKHINISVNALACTLANFYTSVKLDNSKSINEFINHLEPEITRWANNHICNKTRFDAKEQASKWIKDFIVNDGLSS